MPRTRTSLDRQHKVDQILEAAQARLDAEGFDGLTMAGVARDLGLAQAAIYWYFPSRDHLFVGVLERKLTKIVAKKMAKGLDAKGAVLWFSEQLSSFSPYRAAIQERAARSDVVAEFVKGLHVMMRAMLRGALGTHVEEDELDLTVESFIATVEGTFVSRMTARERRTIIAFTLDKIFGS